jgi:hypothetical protein
MVMLVESLGHLLEAAQSEPHLHFPSDEWSKCCTQLFQLLELQTIHNNTMLEFFFHTGVSCLTKKISFVPKFNETSSEVYWVLLSKGTHPIK